MKNIIPIVLIKHIFVILNIANEKSLLRLVFKRKTVSYTHLDVYKRQNEFTSGIGGGYSLLCPPFFTKPKHLLIAIFERAYRFAFVEAAK